jgi:hypothetical protein
MYQRSTTALLRWLRVPPEPQPPHGDPASLRVFRAGPRFLHLRLVKWGVAQVAAFAGIVFWFVVFSDIEKQVEQKRSAPRPAAAAVAANPATPAAPSAAEPGPAPAPGAPATPVPTASGAPAVENPTPPAKESRRKKRERRHYGPFDGFKFGLSGTASFLARLPQGAMLVIWIFEIGGLILYVVQLPVTFLIARLDYELRWYMVTDRSLRIRHGVWKISESTMSFANIQQVVVSQGPVQRLLGLSDVKVQSAGGSSSGSSDGEGSSQQGEDMHLGLFHSVTNPTEIRDLILLRLRHFRESGLGDPDEKRETVSPAPGAPFDPPADALAAARDILAEARALRSTLG